MTDAPTRSATGGNCALGQGNCSPSPNGATVSLVRTLREWTVVAEARDVKDEVVSGASNAMNPKRRDDVANPDAAASKDDVTKRELYEEARRPA